MADNPNAAKMVIVVRRDIVDVTEKDPNKMGVGKLVAQILHGVIGSFLSKMRDGVKFNNYEAPNDNYELKLKVKKGSAMADWLENGFTKVVLGAKTETQFMNSYNKIKEAGFEVTLIQDAGHTVFNGKPTYTCYGVEPAFKEDIDKLTKKLQVLKLQVDC